MKNSTAFSFFSKNFVTKPFPYQIRKIGIECEFPVVDRDGYAAPYRVIKKLFSYLKKNGYTIHYDSHTHAPLSAEKVHTSSARFEYKKDVIGTDYGYAIIELSLTPADSLFELNTHLNEVLSMLIDFFEKEDCSILGYGIQPRSKPHYKLIAKKSRYIFIHNETLNRVLDHRNGNDSDCFTIAASNQCHVDIYKDEAVRAVNIMNELSGVFIALGANAPIWKDQIDPEWKAVREIFWDFAHMLRLSQVGIPPFFNSLEEYFEYIMNSQPLMIKRDDDYFSIYKEKTFKEFMFSKKAVVKDIDQIDKIITPILEDIYTQSCFMWFNARLSPTYGTLEERVFCQQPPGETLVVAAITAGLVECLDKVEKLTSEFSHTDWQRLRLESLRHTYKAKIGGQSIVTIVGKVLEIAEEGLKKRGQHEEVFLEPLFKRLKQRRSPADQAVKLFKKHSMKGLLKETALSKARLYL